MGERGREGEGGRRGREGGEEGRGREGEGGRVTLTVVTASLREESS